MPIGKSKWKVLSIFFEFFYKSPEEITTTITNIFLYLGDIFVKLPQRRTITPTPRFLCIAQVWLENQTKTEPTNFQNYCTRYLVETDSKKKGQSEIDSYSALDIKYGRRRRTGTTAAGPRFGRGIGSEFDP